MARKIIILPSFASSHLLKCSIPNWIDVIEPDIILIMESLFPAGPENKGHVDSYDFRRKWLYHEDDVETTLGFDWLETERVCYEIGEKYPDILIWNQGIKYTSQDVNECFLQAISNFPRYMINGKSLIPEPGDLIFPLEPDVLFHQDDKEKIQVELQMLTPGDGISCVWKDFLETQFYTELINEVSPKWRRFAYCFDNMENYRNAMNAFMTQNYKSLRKVESFIGFHYPWWNPGKYRQLRYDLIFRKDPQYWRDFETGLCNIRDESNYIGKHWSYIPKDKILIRPSRMDEARWAGFIDIEHPIHIESHPNFVK